MSYVVDSLKFHSGFYNWKDSSSSKGAYLSEADTCKNFLVLTSEILIV